MQCAIVLREVLHDWWISWPPFTRIRRLWTLDITRIVLRWLPINRLVIILTSNKFPRYVLASNHSEYSNGIIIPAIDGGLLRTENWLYDNEHLNFMFPTYSLRAAGISDLVIILSPNYDYTIHRSSVTYLHAQLVIELFVNSAVFVSAHFITSHHGAQTYITLQLQSIASCINEIDLMGKETTFSHSTAL